MTASTASGLRELRRAAGLTQRQLADRARVSVRTIQGLESGVVTRPRASTLELLVGALARAGATTRLPRGAGPPTGAGRSYADRVPTSSSPAVPGPYAFPRERLDRPPTFDDPALLWLEPDDPAVIVTPAGTTTEERFRVCRAFPVELHAVPRWVIDVLARGLRPLDGVEVVDALRAFRGRTTQPTEESR